MPTATDPFVEHCLDLMGGLGALRARRMFGGHGVYLDDTFIAVILRGRLFLKVDAASRPQFEAAASVPFVYDNAGKAVAMGYFSAPDEALESADRMQPWARLARDAALRARAAKPASPRRKSRPGR